MTDVTSPPRVPADDSTEEPTILRDATISMEKANVLAVAFLPACALLLVAHAALWGWGSAAQGLKTAFHPLYFLPALIVSVVVHEGLHAVGFRVAGRAPREAVHFGIHRPTLSPFAGCRVPLPAGAYRVAVLLPAIVLGVAPVAAGLATGAAWATAWGAFMLLTAGGDFVALWAMRSVPSTARVLDHPERVGCRVVG